MSKNVASKLYRAEMQKKGIKAPNPQHPVPNTPNPINNTYEKVSLGASKVPHPFKAGKQSI